MNRDNIEVMSKLPIPELDRLLEVFEARHDRANADDVRAAIQSKGAIQSAELFNSGRLIPHRHYDPDTNRVYHTFTGDPKCWMSAYESQGACGRINYGLGTGQNSPEAKARAAATVTTVLRPGERIQVIKAA